MKVSITKMIYSSLVCSFALIGCDCSSSQTSREPKSAIISSRKPNKRDKQVANKNMQTKRQEDMDCAFMLARVYSAISNINFNFHMPDGNMPSQEDTELIAKHLYGIMPRCPRANIVGQGGISYYVATAGPTPTTRRDVLAYEVPGNHRSYRHVLFKGGSIRCMSEDEWDRMLNDHRYMPVVPVLMNAYMELRPLVGQ
jgi:hypothetical protein